MTLKLINLSRFIVIPFLLFIILADSAFAQQDDKERRRKLLQDANVESKRKEIEITVQSVDISNFPVMKIIIEGYNKLGEPLDSLSADNLFVYEKGIAKKVISVEKIPVAEIVPVDFIFVVDITGSMQPYINSVKDYVSTFTTNLVKRGIDYTLSLILFDDEVNRIHQPTKNVIEFMGWLNAVKARGGGDEKENALEALRAAATKINSRFEANKVCVLVTDAPYHQKGEDGHGVTNLTTESAIELLQRNDVRVFSIVPPKLKNYATIAKKTRGNNYDIEYPFSQILDNFSRQITNLFILTYRSDQTIVPDSIDIGILNEDKMSLSKKTIPIVELGRKLIIENLLYSTNSYDLPDMVNELEILTDFLKSKPKLTIVIEGHTDNIGSHELNDNLSLLRAESVRRYLIKKGIGEHRISTKGYGKRKPLASNRSEMGRKLNRRTEIIIVSG